MSSDEVKTNSISRRRFLKVGSSAAAAAIVAGIGGYLAYQQATTPPPESNPIKLGLLSSMTGALADYGFWNLRVTTAAVDYVNRNGGIAGRPVELVVEDDTTDPTTGARKMRRLILESEVDFVIGSIHSGVNIACNPVAKERKTLHFANGEAYETTAGKGNRYVFRVISNVRAQVKPIPRWAIEEQGLGRKWTLVAMDYSFGWAHRDWLPPALAEAGGELLDVILVPLGTTDFTPFIPKIPSETEVLYHVVVGPGRAAFLQQLKDFGFKGRQLFFVDSIEGSPVEPRDLLEGSWVWEAFPRRLASYDTPANREYRTLVGVDEEGRAVEDPNRHTVFSHMYSYWETVFLLKQAIEESGWRSKTDDPTLIRTLEKGLTVNEGIEHPQGSKTLRAEDHQFFTQHWMSLVEDGKLNVKVRFPKEESIYTPEVDYTTESI
ncbi:MAG: ABC transporter substrate-binding protein [Candidatus Bathyarchaeia archaeon]